MLRNSCAGALAVLAAVVGNGFGALGRCLRAVSVQVMSEEAASMNPDQAWAPDKGESEVHRLLSELDHIIDYWDYRACVATTEKAVALFLKKKTKCLKMADEAIRATGSSRKFAK